MCTLHHFAAQYMHALYHERCIQKCYQIAHHLKYFFIYIYNWVHPRDIKIPSPYLCTFLSASCTHIQQNFQKSSKRCGYSSCIASSCSQVASSRTILGPFDLYKPYGSIPEMFDFLVQNAYQNALGKHLLTPPESHSN
jgi:hypothetical protein